MDEGSPGRMLLLIDENVPRSVADLFRERGHDVRLVLDLFLPGTPDPVIATIGDRMSALVVTWDKDFDSLRLRLAQHQVPEAIEAAAPRRSRRTASCHSPGCARGAGCCAAAGRWSDLRWY